MAVSIWWFGVNVQLVNIYGTNAMPQEYDMQ